MDYAETSGTKETVKALHSAALVRDLLHVDTGLHNYYSLHIHSVTLVVHVNDKFCFQTNLQLVVNSLPECF